jgi:hypothetical protein
MLESYVPRTPTDALLRAILNGADFDWPPDATGVADVLALIERYDVAPLVHHRLREAGRDDGAPSDILAALKAATRRQASLDVLHAEELGRILPAARAAGIDVLLLKGTPLGYLRYPASYARTKLDTDLFVRAERYRPFLELLEGMGYRKQLSATGNLVSRQATYIKGGILLDVHRDISNSALFADTLTFDELWKSRAPVPALGDAAFAPDATGMLLHACFHLALHIGYEFRLMWICDVHRLVEAHDPAGFERFLNLAKEKGIFRLCARSVRLSRAWFDTGFSEEILENAEKNVGSERSEAIVAPGLNRRQRFWIENGGLSWAALAAMAWEMAVPSPDYMKLRYGRSGRAALPGLYLARWREAARAFFSRGTLVEERLKARVNREEPPAAGGR